MDGEGPAGVQARGAQEGGVGLPGEEEGEEVEEEEEDEEEEGPGDLLQPGGELGHQVIHAELVQEEALSVGRGGG